MKTLVLLGLVLAGCVDNRSPGPDVMPTRWSLGLLTQPWTCNGQMTLAHSVDPIDGQFAENGNWSCVDDQGVYSKAGTVFGKRDAAFGGTTFQFTASDGTAFFANTIMNPGGILGWTSHPGGPAGFSAGPLR